MRGRLGVQEPMRLGVAVCGSQRVWESRYAGGMVCGMRSLWELVLCPSIVTDVVMKYAFRFFIFFAKN